MTGRDLIEGALSLVVVGGIVGIAIYDAIAGKPVTVPPELYGFGGIIIGSYFRGNGLTNGAVAALKAVGPLSGPPPAPPPPAAAPPGGNAA
jgi:hypothetical protein